jgi:hypothetical protein
LRHVGQLPLKAKSLWPENFAFKRPPQLFFLLEIGVLERMVVKVSTIECLERLSNDGEWLVYRVFFDRSSLIYTH